MVFFNESLFYILKELVKEPKILSESFVLDSNEDPQCNNSKLSFLLISIALCTGSGVCNLCFPLWRRRMQNEC